MANADLAMYQAIAAITDMARGMGKRVVAEYVEDGDILAILADLGVDFAQGYHLGRPQSLPPGICARPQGSPSESRPT